MADVVDVTDVTHRYGKTVALDRMDLTVPKGRIIGLVGPNGCGKTTLIRLIVGRLRASEGEVEVHVPPAGIGYMPQQGGTFPDLRVEDNVAFFARVQGVPRRHLDKAVAEALKTVAMEERRRDRVRELSGGMQRRVSLACAMVHRPALLVLDEPTVGVDPELRENMWDDLHRLKKRGATVVLSTHYLGEANRCDGVVFMRRGHVLAHGTPKQLMHRARAEDMDEAFVHLLERQEGE